MSGKHSQFNDPIRVYKTIFLWSSDGWVYDVTAKMRRQYLTTDGADILEMKQEKLKCLYLTDIEYSEEIDVEILSETPLVWKETSDSFCEVYASVSPKSKHK